MKKNIGINNNNKIIHNIYREDNDLEKEIRKSKKEAKKNSIPLNYIKIDEKISTTVYKIPINMRILKEPNKNNYSHNIQNKLNNINSDKLHNNKLNNNFFPMKPFSSFEMGYKYYNQKLNEFYPHNRDSNNFLYLRKVKSPSMQRACIRSRMNNSDNFINHKNNRENLVNKRRCHSPTNSVKTKRLYSPFYQRYLNKSGILNNNSNYLNENTRIRHRIIGINRPNILNNSLIINNKPYYHDINNYNKTINYNNISSNNENRIYLDNYTSNSFYSIDNLHIFHSPKIKFPQRIINDKYIGTPNKSINYRKLFSENIHKSIENILSKNRKHKYFRNKYDKNKVNKDYENNEIEEIDYSRINKNKDLEYSHIYKERKEVKNPLKNEKICQIRRNPIHIYRFGNSITQNNKKVYLKAPPIKGKLISFYRNNDNNCRMCLINEEKKRKLSPIHYV